MGRPSLSPRGRGHFSTRAYVNAGIETTASYEAQPRFGALHSFASAGVSKRPVALIPITRCVTILSAMIRSFRCKETQKRFDYH